MHLSSNSIDNLIDAVESATVWWAALAAGIVWFFSFCHLRSGANGLPGIAVRDHRLSVCSGLGAQEIGAKACAGFFLCYVCRHDYFIHHLGNHGGS